MFENGAKGWHGSYSIIGKNSAEKYPMILLKDKILKNQFLKKQIKTYFSTVDEPETITEEGEDIFSKVFKLKNKTKSKKLNEICEYITKEKVPEKYKYHQLHHMELHHYNELMQNRKDYSSNLMYSPKKDYVFERTVTGPSWNILTGREKGYFDRKKDYLDNIDFYLNHNNPNKNKTGIILMDKQIERKNLPISNDLRIRINESFENSKNKDNNKHKELGIGKSYKKINNKKK